MRSPLNEKEIKAVILPMDSIDLFSSSSDMTAEVSEGKDLSGGPGSFLHTLLSSCFLSLVGRRDKRLIARVKVEFLCGKITAGGI